jgi:hypothetical protein
MKKLPSIFGLLSMLLFANNIKAQTPLFKINPESQVIYCENLSGYTFRVDNINNSTGTLSYSWDIGSGWNSNDGLPINSTFSTTANSIQLRPADYTRIPSNIKVTPILNGVKQPTKICSITRSEFNSAQASITGNNLICSSSNGETYSIVNLIYGQTVGWTTDVSGIATVQAINSTQVKVTKIKDGTFNLIARIYNGCGQSINISKSITIGGAPNFDLTSKRLSIFSTRYITTMLTTVNQGITSTTWTEVRSDGATRDCSINGNLFMGATGKNAQIIVTATNSCGTSTQNLIVH